MFVEESNTFNQNYIFNVNGSHAIIKNGVLNDFKEESEFIARVISHFVKSVNKSMNNIGSS